MTTGGGQRSVALQLYRSILRAHSKHLPEQMRQLGDVYVKTEFRAHKSAKPEQVQNFMQEWQSYLNQILQTARARESVSTGALDNNNNTKSTQSPFEFGRDLGGDVELSEDQVAQLEKLKQEATKAPGRN